MQRRLSFAGILFLVCALSLCRSLLAQGPNVNDEFSKTVVPFLKTHCIRCHGAKDQEGNFRVDDDLPNDFLDVVAHGKWEEVVDVLNSHEMPPEDEAQPAPEQVAKVVDWITSRMIEAERVNHSNRIVMRRLNRVEYKNTIASIFGIDYDIGAFPQDPSAGGFDNNGNALVVSPMLLELYFEAAQEILDRVLVEGEQPKPIKWRFQHEEASGDYNWKDYGGQKIIVHGGACRKEGGFTVMHHNQWDLIPNAREFRLQHPGDYIIRVRAAGRVPSREEVIQSARIFYGRRRDHDLSQTPDAYEFHQKQYEKNIAHFKTERIYDYGAPRLRLNLNLGGQPSTLDEFDVAAPISQPEIYEFPTRLTKEKVGIYLEYAYDVPKLLENFWFQHETQFARPEVWLDWTEIEGPIYDSWPPSSHRRIIPDEIPADKEAWTQLAEKTIRSFAYRAYRRPATADEIQSKLALFREAAQETDSFVEAIKRPLTAIMVSPKFLFMAEPAENLEGDKQLLTSFEFATRLSYFLWSGPPDNELLSLAMGQQLRKREVLLEQVDRMLASRKGQQFTKNFCEQWLGLREVGVNPPTPDYFPRYDRHLEESIVEETLRFCHEVLTNDLSCENFIDSDFVVINERLARFYDIPDVAGDQFRKVPIAENSPRGGLLTHTSMLTITSNGTRTSPVKRGTWVLKNILGTDPGIPVANAGEIAPSVPGIDKATVRQRLEIHRELPQCARCHNKIDPLGFALENFDASGRWREREGFGYKGRVGKNDPLIDASSKLPDGTSVVGVDGLKSELLKRKDLVYRCLIEKLFAYALGREMTLSDRPLVEEALKHMKDNRETLRSVIQFIVNSDEFQSR